MVAISFAAWVFGLVLMTRILEEVAPDFLEVGVLVYGVFPLVGITNVAGPLADTTGQTLFLAAFYATQRNWKWAFIAATAMGLIVHMVLWPFLFLLSITWLIRRRLAIWHVLLSGAPLALYYILIAVGSGDWLWFFRRHYHVNFKSTATLPLFAAIEGPFETGSVAGMIKAALITSVVVVAALLAAFAWRRRNWLMLTTLLPLLLFASTVNASEAFIVVRYAGFVVIPLCSWAAVNARRRALLTSRRCIWATALLLVISQWAWAAYTVEYFAAL